MRQMLSFPGAYIALQRAMGADVLRHRCIDALEPEAGTTMIDVGCGPAYYLDRLPQPIDYHGFDTERRYIEWASERWAGLGQFHLGVFDDVQATEIGPADSVMLLGILHHLCDDAASELLALTSRALAPDGKAVAVDTCIEPSQGHVSRWMARHDRGDFVRSPDEFVRLAEQHLDILEGDLMTDTRMPGSYWYMLLAHPTSSS